MIEISEVSTYGWDAAIKGMRNPMNSWGKSDSKWRFDNWTLQIGENDKDLMMRLAKAGTEHSKYRRMITVTCDIKAPLYWWKEFDTYKVGTVRNSCSTMHKLAAAPLTIEDFSYEHLNALSGGYLLDLIDWLNDCRATYESSSDIKWWWQMIQLLPSSYNQCSTVLMNYEVLAAMYKQRKSHKLDEWQDFCKFVENLPHAFIITGLE